MADSADSTRAPAAQEGQNHGTPVDAYDRITSKIIYIRTLAHLLVENNDRIISTLANLIDDLSYEIESDADMLLVAAQEGDQ